MQVGFELFAFNALKAFKAAKQTIKDRRGFLKSCGVYFLARVFETFAKEGAREGHEKWEDLSPATIIRRRNKKKSTIKILQDTGEMRKRFDYTISDESIVGEVIIGTDVSYAKYHQFGLGQKIREMIFVTPGDMEKFKEIVSRRIGEAFSEAK